MSNDSYTTLVGALQARQEWFFEKFQNTGSLVVPVGNSVYNPGTASLLLIVDSHDASTPVLQPSNRVNVLQLPRSSQS